MTKDIRLPIFQFKIVHHILPTNATLFRDEIAQHDKCHHCDQKQTLNHLFVSCPNVQTFWQSFSRWWNVKNDDFIVLIEETIIYGFTNDFSQQRGLNLCLIIAKYCIYCASRDGENYCFEAFLAYLKSKLSIEKSKCKSQIIWQTPGRNYLNVKLSKQKTEPHDTNTCVCFCFLFVFVSLS